MKFLPLSGGNWRLVVVFDNCAVGVLLILTVCFLHVYFYIADYFSGSGSGVESKKMMRLFVGVMASL